MSITVLGGSGFIGSHLVRRLQELGVPHEVPARDTNLAGRDLGVAIYCIGLTADFRERPFDAVEAHVARVATLLRSSTFESFVYLSSARVYRRCSSPATEDVLVPLSSADPDDLYDLTKLAGEATVLAAGPGTRVLRLSNVFGPDPSSPNFLSSVIREALVDGEIVLRTSLESWKDYVSVDDVVDMILQVSGGGEHRIYNVAGGVNVSHREITDSVARVTGCRIVSRPGCPTLQPPKISIARIQSEFGFRPASLMEHLTALVASCRSRNQSGGQARDPRDIHH